jgi:hypothetical protein
MSASLNPKPFRPIQCRRPIRTPKGYCEEWRRIEEENVREVTRRGLRIEDTAGFGREHWINRFRRALQIELLHSEGWPIAG